MYILVSLLFVVAIALGARILKQHQASRKSLIDEGRFLSLGGIQQWVRIRGEDRSNPVLLFLHGGPGVSYEPFSDVFAEWEKHFTLVFWDQRGAGKTFGRNRSGGMTIERMAADGIELAELLRMEFDQPKIVLFAHSWGTILGLTMIRERPELFEAYVGTGQVVSMALSEPMSYELLLQQARSTGKMVRPIEALGPPPYRDMKTWMRKQRAIVMTAPPQPEGRKLPDIFLAPLVYRHYSLRDAVAWYSAFGSALKDLYGQFMEFDARDLGSSFEVPVYFFQGSRDVQAPLATVEEYVTTLRAPVVDLVVLEGEDHSAVLSNPPEFLQLMLARIKR